MFLPKSYRTLLATITLAGSLMVGGIAGSGTYSAGASPETGSPWTRYQLTGTNVLDVDTVSATDAWAVGYDGLIAHWDGIEWHTLDNSKLIGAATVNAVDMLSPTQAWAHSTGGVMLRYNGTNWATEPSNFSTSMNAISVISPTYGWAAGSNATFARYDGTQWTQVAASPSVTETMYGVATLSTTDAWAVGGVTIPNVGPQGKIAHWDGANWTAFTSPVNNRIFYAVNMLNANEGWAVGMGGTTLHWNGSAWTLVPPPSVCTLSCGAVTLTGVHTTSANDAWAVGTTNASTSNTWHWDGSVWTEIPTPNGAPLNAVAMLSSSDGWIVGDRGTIFRWNGSSWAISNSHWTTYGLYALDFLSPSDGWAVGVLNTSPPAYGLQHWNGSTWDIYQAPSNTPGPMKDVKMLASNQVWAVGSQAVFFWNGTNWTQQSATGNFMDALSMVSPTDGWAVGSSGKIVHFDGTSWTNYTSPTTTNLWSLDMVNANEGWAGGTLGLMLHYLNGTWTQVTPNPGSTTIEAIDMVDANEGWAVGYTGQILHYSGGTWSPVSSPTINNLLGVQMINANEGWAVGNSATGSTATILHYTGGTWSLVNSPTRNNLRDIFVFPNGQGWATSEAPGTKLYLGTLGGGTPTPTRTGTPATNTPVSTNTVTRTATSLPTATSTRTATGVPTLPATPHPSSTSTITSTPQATGTATPTQPGATATATATATNIATQQPTETITIATATSIASPTATSCTLQFTDVPADNTFYPFIRCLACRGIINGYPCGGVGEPCNGNNDPYFRSGNNLSRGQLAKIVAQAAGLNGTVSGQSFEDVLPGTAFYTFTERLYAIGAIGGYQCGIDPGEPCGVGNKPYYRPGASVTRGQLTKIVSNAAGFNDPAPNTFTFTDVPVGSTFHVYVERLLLNRPGVMSGYPCGGPGEPCDDQNRPYFRVNANLTRGQASKIVSNTFFPNCQTPTQ